MKFCIIIPVYNSEKHVIDVIKSVLRCTDVLIVVNDGSTDHTLEQIRNQKFENIELLHYTKNKGKGYALQQGFKKALELGCTHAISMDADGQHLADDIADLKKKAIDNSQSLIIGSRRFDNPNMPQENRFANKFSNFWFMLQTGRKLPDTQTGFRVYPLLEMGKMRLCTNRYEAELELLVRCAWRNIELIPQPINVYYPPLSERISHFRASRDFLRISILNTILCFVAVFYGYPSLIFRKLFKIK